MKIIIKLLNLFALLGSVAWLSKNQEWGPIITFLTLLALFLGQEISSVIKKTNNEDKKLGKLFLKQFSSNGNICIFLKEHELHNPFHSSRLDEIEKFLRKWNNTEHEFLSKKLERMRKKLLNKVNNFISSLSRLTRVHNQNVNVLTTKLSYTKIDTKEDGNRNNLNDLEVNKLNKIATDIYINHQKLTKKIKKLLNS